MSHLMPLLGLVLSLHAEPALASSGDDFSNNLLNDLTPLLALFGERVTTQFMSQSMGIADCIIMASAPVGILTVVISAIRVGGPVWLKAIIGRARENLSEAELELMSSTSDESCELWNGRNVVRCPGSARISQFICLIPDSIFDSEKNDQDVQVEVRLLDDAKKAGLLQRSYVTGPTAFASWIERKCVWTHSKSRQNTNQASVSDSGGLTGFARRLRTFIGSRRDSDIESVGSPLRDTAHPDNCRSNETLAKFATRNTIQNNQTVSTHGLVLQCPGKHRPRFYVPSDQNSQNQPLKITIIKDVDETAPNLSLNCHDRVSRGELYVTAILAVLVQLCVLCYFGSITLYKPWRIKLHKSSHDSYAFPLAAIGSLSVATGVFICSSIVERSTTESYLTAHEGMGAYLVWLQKDHKVSDQVFKPFAMFPKRKRAVITKSVRRNSVKGSSNGSDLGLETGTVIGAITALLGFFLQFIGLRGMSWTASITQLAAIALMTSMRSWIRRGLTEAPASVNLLSEFELDWLALSLGSLKYMPWSARSPVTNEVSKEQSREPGDWLAAAGVSQEYLALDGPYLVQDDVPYCPPRTTEQKVMSIRQNLGELTDWRGPATDIAIKLTEAIEAVMHIVLPDSTSTLIREIYVWKIPASYDSADGSNVEIRIQWQEGRWKAHAGQIESILSLWLFALRRRSADNQDTRGRSSNAPNGGDSRLRATAPKGDLSLRIIGPLSQGSQLLRDLRWWLPKNRANLFEVELQKPETSESQNTTQSSDQQFHDIQHTHIIGFGENIPESLKADRSAQPLKFSSRSIQMQKPIMKLEKVSGYLADFTREPVEKLLARNLLYRFIRSIFQVQSTQITTPTQEVIPEKETSEKQKAQNWRHSGLQNDTIETLVQQIEASGICSYSEAKFDLILALSAEQKLPDAPILVQRAQKPLIEEIKKGRWGDVGDILNWQLDLSVLYSQNLSRTRLQAICSVLHYVHHCERLIEACRPAVNGVIAPTEMRPVRDKLRGLQDELGGLSYLAKLFGMQGQRWSRLLTSESRAELGLPIDSDASFDFPDSLQLSVSHLWAMGKPIPGRRLVPSCAKDILGCTPLHYAVAFASIDLDKGMDMIDRLIQAHRDLANVQDMFGWSALHVACVNNNPRVVAKLLSRGDGASVDLVSAEGLTAVHYAAGLGHVDVLKIILEAPQPENLSPLGISRGQSKESLDNARSWRDPDGLAPIHWAARANHWSTVALLATDVELEDSFGRTILEYAIKYRHNELFDQILDQLNPDLNRKDAFNETPIHGTVHHQNEHALTALISRKAHVSTADSGGDTPLHEVCRLRADNTINLVKILIKNGAPILVLNHSQETPIHVAIDHGHYPALHLMLDALIEANPLGLPGGLPSGRLQRTLLHLAAGMRKEDNTIPKLIKLSKPADIDATDYEGHTALFRAASGGHIFQFKLLLEAGAKIEVPGPNGKMLGELLVSDKYIHSVSLSAREQMRQIVADQGISEIPKDGRESIP